MSLAILAANCGARIAADAQAAIGDGHHHSHGVFVIGIDEFVIFADSLHFQDTSSTDLEAASAADTGRLIDAFNILRGPRGSVARNMFGHGDRSLKSRRLEAVRLGASGFGEFFDDVDALIDQLAPLFGELGQGGEAEPMDVP